VMECSWRRRRGEVPARLKRSTDGADITISHRLTVKVLEKHIARSGEVKVSEIWEMILRYEPTCKIRPSSIVALKCVLDVLREIW
jgi:hypothetical protein